MEHEQHAFPHTALLPAPLAPVIIFLRHPAVGRADQPSPPEIPLELIQDGVCVRRMRVAHAVCPLRTSSSVDITLSRQPGNDSLRPCPAPRGRSSPRLSSRLGRPLLSKPRQLPPAFLIYILSPIAPAASRVPLKRHKPAKPILTPTRVESRHDEATHHVRAARTAAPILPRTSCSITGQFSHPFQRVLFRYQSTGFGVYQRPS